MTITGAAVAGSGVLRGAGRSSQAGPTEIILPVQRRGPLTVSVTARVNCGGSACISGPVSFTYTVGLSIFGFTPDHGDANTTVTITGQGFVAPLIVTFGGSQGTVISVSGTQVLAKPPAEDARRGIVLRRQAPRRPRPVVESGHDERARPAPVRAPIPPR